MINIDKLKMVLFDFDDTLAVHNEHKSGTAEDQLNYDTLAILGDFDAYKDCAPNQNMVQFMQLCKDRKLQMGLISANTGYYHMDLKQKWVKEKYGISLENYCVMLGEEEKAKAICAIANAFYMNHDELLIVDDNPKVIVYAADAGFQSATPIEVINFINNLSKK